jgi:hypothetical protein
LTEAQIKTKAVITDEKLFWPNNPVSHTFTYYYKFKVDSEIYKGKSWDEELRVGDSLGIEYAETYPNFNRPISKRKLND